MYLMHENNPVAEVEVSCGQILIVKQIFNARLLPVGTRNKDKTSLPNFLRSWQKDRAIPFERDGIEIYTMYFQSSILESAQYGHSLSLTDHYWFKPNDSAERWEDICFQLNGFSNEFASFFLDSIKPFSEYRCPGMPNFKTPDINTDGMLTKIWVNTDDGAKLYKFGEVPGISQKNLLSANEVVASKIGKLMDMDIVEYAGVLLPDISNPVCICDNFVPFDCEFVTAMQLYKETPGRSLYETICSMGYEKEVQDMLKIDILTHQTDRHLKNFGYIRDSKNLSPVKFAPIFDSGSCLNWNRRDDMSIKPFKPTRTEQLSMVKDFKNIPELKTVQDIVEETYQFFEIEPEQFEYAVNDIKNTYQMIEKSLSKQITGTEIERE